MACCRNRGFVEGYYPGCGNGYYYGEPRGYNGFNGYNGCDGYIPPRNYYPGPCNRHDEVVFDVHLEVPEHRGWY